MKLKQDITRSIHIAPADNGGFIAHVGCGSFIFPDKNSLIAGLSDYLDDPEEHENRYHYMKGGGDRPEAPQPETVTAAGSGDASGRDNPA